MFALVADVDSYPKFLPWCGGARVVEQQGDEVLAEIEIAYHGIHRTFRTRNRNRSGEEILIRLVSGPFSHLRGRWHFEPLGDDACRVSLDIEFDFSGRLVGRLVGPVFRQISGSLVEAFCSRAREVYER
jgi:ribosome-associated toxin RatA of RatAB toxin-antitoxin module